MKTIYFGALLILATVLVGLAHARPGDRVERHPFAVNPEFKNQNLLPVVVAAPGGDFVIAWTVDLGGDADNGIVAQHFGADGLPQGSRFRVSPVDTDPQRGEESPAIAMNDTGNFVVIWLEANGLGHRQTIRAQRFNSANVPQGGMITVAGEFSGRISGPKVAMSATGAFVVAWSGGEGSSGGSSSYLRLVAANGVPQGDPVRLNQPLAADFFAFQPSVDVDASGRIIAAWVQEQLTVARTKVFARRFSAAGVPQGTQFQVPTASGTTFVGAGNGDALRVAADASGNFVVAFQRVQNGGPFGSESIGIFARRYDAAGVIQGSEIKVSAPGRVQFRGEMGLDMDAAGEFVVGWIANTPALGETYLHTRLFNASGSALMPDRSYGFDHVGPRDENIAMDGEGNFIATWEHSVNDSNADSGPHIFAQRFAGPSDVRPGCAAFISNIVGTTSGDTLFGTDGDDVISGLGGDDVIHGGAGADSICGNAGNDQLFGDAGTDHLLGGAGDDALNGGADSDICDGSGQVSGDTASQCESIIGVP